MLHSFKLLTNVSLIRCVVLGTLGVYVRKMDESPINPSKASCGAFKDPTLFQISVLTTSHALLIRHLGETL